MRVLFWNIMHGGGYRAGKIVEQILEWNPDVVALAEFRGAAPSQSIAESLYDAGYKHQLSTVFDDEPAWNALFVASRFEISTVRLDGAPEPDYLWMLVKLHTKPSLHFGVILVPLGDQWYEYFDALVRVAKDWQLGAGVIIGDTNCALTGLDEDTEFSGDFKDRFMNPLKELGWRDAFRSFQPQVDAPTWFSPYGNGFRLDQAYANAALQARVTSCDYDWGNSDRRGKLSDHAAILLDLELPG